MLNWITGTKMVDEADVNDTRLEPPETPAPVFAVRALKHAIFGTPQPPPTVAPLQFTKKRKNSDKPDAIAIPSIQPASDTEPGNLSPTKQGILLTPGTVRGKKKEVTFGAQVLDNGSKKPSRSGIPNNCPGKFPSPWTPKVADLPEELRPKTKLTAALYEAKATGTTPRDRKLRTRDDADITLDIMEPRSESGRYWKEMYIEQHQKSEEQIGKLTAKYKLCKEHARRKDDEATDLKRQVEGASKKHRAREKELEKQVKELREQLRLQMAENAKTCTEISLLRRQLGESPLEASTKKLKRALEKFETTEIDLNWIDNGGEDVENKVPEHHLGNSGAKPHGKHGHPTRSGYNKSLARKQGSVARQDSVFTPNGKLEFENSVLELSPTPKPSKDIRKPLRRILGDMSPNVASSPPMPSFFSESDHEKIMAKVSRTTVDTENRVRKMHSPTHREAMAEAAASLSHKQDFSILEDLAPMSALSLQAEQPITPVSISRKQIAKALEKTSSAKRHRRTEATTGTLGAPVGLDDARAKAAKERLEARRAKRHTRVR